MIYRGAQNYERLTPLGRGPSWTAFLAKAEDGSLVELRLMETTIDKVRWASITRRLQLLSLLQHANIRRIRDIAADHKPPFFVTEFLPGTALSLLEKTTPLNILQLLQLGLQLLQALSEAHRLGVFAGPINTDAIAERATGTWAIDLCQPAFEFDDSRAERGNGQNESDRDDRGSLSDLQTICELLKKLAIQVKVQTTQVSQLMRVLDQTSQSSAESQTVSSLASELQTLAKSIADTHPDPVLRKSVDESDEARIDKTIVGAPAPESGNSPEIPKRLGRFELLECLGRGAVGAVFRAIDISNGQVVAIKILDPRLARNAVVVRRFEKEARMLARVENPYIAKIFDANSDQGHHFLAIEYVAGGTLAELIQGGLRLAEQDALLLILDVARGLAVAHQLSVFHRDVKPENILLTAEGACYMKGKDGPFKDRDEPSVPFAKLSDFGLARMDQQSDSLAITNDGAILGTPLYMSPEQCRGLAADARSDVYALGATLFQLLSGRPPFAGDNHIAVMNAHCNDPVPSLSRICPDVSDACISVVEKCLAKTADARYQDAMSLQLDMERLLHGEPTSMMVHPGAPGSHGRGVLEFQFTCELRSSPAQLWTYVSNTDRINHAMGLSSITYTTRTDPIRGVERFAETRIAGQKLKWQEHPYEWIEGQRLSVLREFSTGPFFWFMNIVNLTPLPGGGTMIKQIFRVVPRNWLGVLIAKFQLGHSVPRAFRRVYAQIDDFQSRSALSDPSSDPFAANVAITNIGRTRLRQRLTHLQQRQIDPAVIETLRQFIEHASDLEVARIRPLVFAERFQLNPKQVIEGCLVAAKEGLLVLLWDILCPSCKIPADVQQTLASLKEHSYCPSCDLKYEIDFANSVELIFRAHPEVRTAETRTYCIGGPAFSTHVVAQTHLAPSERLELELSLSEGSYQLRGAQLPFSVDLRVSSGAGVTRLELPLLRPPIPGSIPILRQGTQVLSLLNNTTRDLQIRLERTAGRQMALTAAAAASLPLFREIFPDEVLAPGQIVSVTSVTLLMIELCSTARLYRDLGDGPAFGKVRASLQRSEDVVRSSGGAIVKIVGEGFLATYTDAFSALQAASSILNDRETNTMPMRLALHRGSALVTTLNDRLDYFGESVHTVRSMLQSATPGEMLASATILHELPDTSSVSELGLLCELANISISESAVVIYHCRPHPK